MAPSPTLASVPMPIDEAQTLPTQNQSIVVGAASVAFKVVAPGCTTAEMVIEVASQETYESNGSFSDTVQRDYFTLPQTGPGVFEGQTSAAWVKAPAAYYWQAYAVANCGGVFEYMVEHVGPTRTLTIAPRPSRPVQTAVPVATQQTLSVAQASTEVANAIRKRTKKAARALKRKCARPGTSVLVVSCTLSWTDSTKYNYTGSMRLTRNDDGTLSARFDGRRAQRTCVKKGGGKRCYKKWKFSYEELG